MTRLIGLIAIATGISGVGLTGLGFASTAHAELAPFPETLCPFRNVINAMGGDDECDPTYGWGNNPVSNPIFPNNGMPCDSVAFPNPACNPTINVNVHRDGNNQP